MKPEDPLDLYVLPHLGKDALETWRRAWRRFAMSRAMFHIVAESVSLVTMSNAAWAMEFRQLVLNSATIRGQVEKSPISDFFCFYPSGVKPIKSMLNLYHLSS